MRNSKWKKISPTFSGDLTFEFLSGSIVAIHKNVSEKETLQNETGQKSRFFHEKKFLYT